MEKKTKISNDINPTNKIISNIFSLLLLQGTNYILPLITLPYLIRVVGVENFGVIAFAGAISAYFSIITDYGFNLTATREISIHRDKKEKITEIYSSIITIKILLTLASLIALSILIYCFEKLSKDWVIYYITFGSVIGQAILPIWLFQGMEQMKYITLLNISTKLIFTAAIFIFIKEKDDFYLAPLFTSLGTITGGLLSLVIIKRAFFIRYETQSVQTLKTYLKESWNIFFANLCGNLYGQGNIIVLGALSSPAIVGFYSLSAKLSSALVSIFQIFTQAIFPYLAKLKTENPKKFREIIKKFTGPIFIINTLYIMVISLFSDRIYQLVSGTGNNDAYYTFSFWIFISFITILNIIINPIMLALKHDLFLSKLYFAIGIAFIIFAPFLTYFFSYKGMLYAMMGVEVLIFTPCAAIIIKELKNVP